jgi:prepilin-type N-terminal cleavage/methylation domain-containing protein
MNKYNFILKLKYHLLTTRDIRQQGFTLTECLVGIVVLSIAMIINLQFLAVLQVQNIKQEITKGAVTVSKSTLDDIRIKMKSDVNTVPVTGATSKKLTNVTQSAVIDLPLKTDYADQISVVNGVQIDNFIYTVNYYVCKGKPTINDNDGTVTTCPNGADDNARYIVVQVLNPNNEDEILNTTETVFTALQQKI